MIADHLKKCRRKDGTMVVELKKCLCGLQEAARVWYDLISHELLKCGCMRSDLDKCLSIKMDANGEYLHVTLYVADLLIFGMGDVVVDNVIAMLEERLAGEVTVGEYQQMSFLGLEMNVNPGNIKGSHSNYLYNIVEDA